MKLFRNEEEAVSPVIGVILMVAIVVILAAVIAAFVFGMAGSTASSKNVGMTVTPIPGGGISILWQGGSDLNSLSYITTGGDVTVVSVGEGQIQTWADATATHPSVGEITDVDCGDVTGQRVIITGTFTDGASQVIFDRRY